MLHIVLYNISFDRIQFHFHFIFFFLQFTLRRICFHFFWYLNVHVEETKEKINYLAFIVRFWHLEVEFLFWKQNHWRKKWKNEIYLEMNWQLKALLMSWKHFQWSSGVTTNNWKNIQYLGKNWWNVDTVIYTYIWISHITIYVHRPTFNCSHRKHIHK